MPASSPSRHALTGAAIALALLSSSGCSWVKSKFTTDAPYQDSQLGRPLEAPPGLDLPRTDSGFAVPQAAGGSAGVLSTLPPAVGSSAIDAFVVADTVESTWRRMGLALARIEGVSISAQAQLLNSYEVSYEGQTLLIRAEASGEQSRVSAVGSDGRAMSGGAAAKLLGLLQARLN